MIAVVAGAAFAGKRLWTDQEIERREGEGEVGLLALDFTSIYSAIVPGLASVYRDQRVTDSGAARFAGFVLAGAVREAATRELSGYALTDSPRRAVSLSQTLGGASAGRSGRVAGNGAQAGRATRRADTRSGATGHGG